MGLPVVEVSGPNPYAGLTRAPNKNGQYTWYKDGKPVYVKVVGSSGGGETGGGTSVGPSGFPEDSGYAQSVALAQRQYGDTMAGITQQRGETERAFGFGTDTSNPYSQAKMLEKSYQTNQRSSTNSYAGSGQLYAGSLQNAQNTNRFNYDKGVDEAKTRYQSIIAGLAQREREAGTAQDAAKLGAGFESLNRASQSEPIDYGTPSAGSAAQAPVTPQMAKSNPAKYNPLKGYTVYKGKAYKGGKVRGTIKGGVITPIKKKKKKK